LRINLLPANSLAKKVKTLAIAKDVTVPVTALAIKYFEERYNMVAGTWEW